jgi:hypothetical protein
MAHAVQYSNCDVPACAAHPRRCVCHRMRNEHRVLSFINWRVPQLGPRSSSCVIYPPNASARPAPAQQPSTASGACGLLSGALPLGRQNRDSATRQQRQSVRPAGTPSQLPASARKQARGSRAARLCDERPHGWLLAAGRVGGPGGQHLGRGMCPRAAACWPQRGAATLLRGPNDSLTSLRY